MVPEDPAAVAARKEREFQLTVGLTVGMCVAGMAYAIRFVRDTRQALALRHRPRQPWEVD